MSSDVTTLMLIATAVLVVAFLYSSVGHAGASGYIAVMALAGMAPDVIKPAALVLNILVATIGSFQFWRAGHFRWHLFWPFALCAAPTAFLGGYLPVVPGVFRPLVGLVLLFSAARVLWQPDDPVTTRPPAVPVALGAGAGLGFLAGLTGTGGGIFLTPLMLLRKWATTKTVAATSVLFILVNSAAGLAGFIGSGQGVPSVTWVLAGAAVAGGTAGSWLGSRRFMPGTIRSLLAVVLLIAGAKLVAGG